NPIACTAGLASLDLLLSEESIADRQRIIAAHNTFTQQIKKHSSITDIRQEGTVLAIELYTGAQTSYHHSQRDFIYNFFLERGILMRPLGNIIYLIPPYCISSEQLQQIYSSIEELLTTLSIQ
ncbi:MAG: aminotransferase class III-fold pyridoxal phosphate-dependent enzyme, partial [Bacteroidetes bacterium]|nr:aminotransferase class III-fold pyridoxal phosphate-dependent enzyme [Bacteroidota bacterium]